MNRITTVRTAVGRGWGKRCPHCGRGQLYAGWADALDHCAHCGLVYERDQGATWFFVNLADRIFVGVLILLIYLGIHRFHPVVSTFMFATVGIVAIWTTPNRWGACIALHYLLRLIAGDPDDPVPTVPDGCLEATAGRNVATDRSR